jgi:hypothetical protein
MFSIASNVVRLAMLEAAARQGVPPARISFVDALRWLRHAGNHEQLPPLIVIPDRPRRSEPRVRKRCPKKCCLSRTLFFPQIPLKTLIYWGKAGVSPIVGSVRVAVHS